MTESVIYNPDDNPALYHLRQPLPNGLERANYPQLVVVAARYYNQVGYGMPEPEIGGRLMLFEDRLQALLEPRRQAYLLAMVIFEGVKTWYWYSQNGDETIAIMRLEQQREHPHPEVGITYETRLDKKWKEYERVRTVISDWRNRSTV